MKKIYLGLLIGLVLLGIVSAGILSGNIKKNPDETYTETRTIEVETNYPSLSEIEANIAFRQKCLEDKIWAENFKTQDARLGEAVWNYRKEKDVCSSDLSYWTELKVSLKDVK